MDYKKLYLVFVLVGLFLSFSGCGSSSEDDDWGNTSSVVRVSNLKGRVIASVSGSERPSAREAYFPLASVENTRVFLEDDSSKYAYADKDGYFIIPNVPEGRHRLIANVISGTTTYRQRSDVVVVSGQYETQLVKESIELQPAIYELKLHISDLNTGAPLPAKVKIWGYTFDVINGVASVGPFPGGISKEATIICAGYRDSKRLITFGEDTKSEIYIYLTPTSSTDSNQAPYVEIQQGSFSVKTREEIQVSGIGSDPEGDALTWRWSADAGDFYNKTAQQTLYRAPETPGKVRISLEAKDSKGAFGRAVLELNIEQGTDSEFDPQNKPPVAPNSPYPANGAEDMGDTVVLAWQCEDPNNDKLSYTLNFGEQGKPLGNIATNLTENSFTVNNLKANTKYLWQVTAYDEHYAKTDSSIWEFSTGDLNNLPPNVPTFPSPAHMATGVDGRVAFSWSGGDPDGDRVTYKVYLATISTWIESEPTQLTNIYETNLLKYDYYSIARGATYQWQIVAEDSHGARSVSPVWQFSTLEPENHMPSFASITLPKNDATGVDVNTVLSWSATDEDGDTLYYNVYFDNKADPELVSEKQVSQTYKPQTLEYDTKYYWRVEVSDGRKVNPRSDLWSFTTAKAPVVMPKIASIETPESETDHLSIKFNKHIDSSKMSKAVKFVPELSGTWTWTDDNKIARFIPESGSWWPGSYNAFTLTANILSDAEGNLMTEERSESFTIPSSVAVPAGYRSYGFPIQVPRNTTFSVSVPNLAYGKNSYILAIADADKTSGTVSSMRASLENIERIKEKDPTHALRLREAEMIHIPISTPKRSSIDASVRASTLGETRDFYIDEIAESGDSITATLMALSVNTKIYVDNSIIDSNKNTKAQEFLSVFESKVLQKVRDAFGNEPEIGVDGDSRISIVLFDCKNDGLAGYFTNVDLYSKSVFAKSNECKAFYVSYSTELFTAFATLAHEFQHMINYYQKNKNPSSPQILEEVWVNEGLSELAQQVCGYSLLDGDYNTTALTKLSMENNKNLSLTYWGDDTVNCYGQVFLFMRFVAQPGRYNSDSIQISRALVNADDGKKLGEKNIENVTGEPFKETMAKWALSCFINNYGDNSPSAYGIYGINLKGRYNSVQLPGYEIENISGSISLSNMRKNSMRCFKKASTGSGNTTITISTGNQPITLWCFDERN